MFRDEEILDDNFGVLELATRFLARDAVDRSPVPPRLSDAMGVLRFEADPYFAFRVEEALEELTAAENTCEGHFDEWQATQCERAAKEEQLSEKRVSRLKKLTAQAEEWTPGTQYTENLRERLLGYLRDELDRETRPVPPPVKVDPAEAKKNEVEFARRMLDWARQALERHLAEVKEANQALTELWRELSVKEAE